jgi:hypothetical protein
MAVKGLSKRMMKLLKQKYGKKMGVKVGDSKNAKTRNCIISLCERWQSC